jgi:hypothetical protein
MPRYAISRDSGELFIETPDSRWKMMLDAWRQDHRLPCPMPQGHIMFRPDSFHYETFIMDGPTDRTLENQIALIF